jgi:UDPglucose 6-dehydrogenase
MDAVKKYYPGLNVRYTADRYEAATGADALLIVTEWGEFRTAELDKLKTLMRTPAVFDGRNVYEAEAFKGTGIYYASIGRQEVAA